MSHRSLWLALALAACASPKEVETSLVQAQQTVDLAHQVYAPLCAPRELAQAESNLDFARLELRQGHVPRAGEHAGIAQTAAVRALEIATPCGSADDDQDTVPNVVDACPNEKEDLDGVQDEDGCRDIDATGDEDGDGILNIDDGCPDEPEDFDGHNDEDGCPETSEDSDGDGIIDAVDNCTDEPEDLDGFKDSDGCPDDDNDGDGIIDINDTCPMVAEDPDAWMDDDGCPDADNDEDGIPDVNDKCPNVMGGRANDGCPDEDADKDGIADADDRCPEEPETINRYLDDDGCPDTPPSRVKVTREKVEITEIIQFETGKATLKSSSNGVLDDVVQVLKDAPEMKLRIEGHTDSQGDENTNLKLSRARADAVRKYIVGKGIDASRLTAEGFGESRPIDTNRTSNGRARNRRVEFVIQR